MTSPVSLLTSDEESFLCSELATEGRFLSLAQFSDWLAERTAQNRFRVTRIPFRELDGWAFTDSPKHLVHRSGKFFRIEGVRTETDFGPVRAWDQPIINQPEIGILGIVTRVFDGVRYFLMQAKMEPGTVNYVQIAPTVQATRSNLTRVHGGKRPAYLDYFVDRGRSRVLVDQLQSEQASRFLHKRNRNMVVEVTEEVPVEEGFCWLTLGQIKRLLRRDNVINMDARTVISCLPFTRRSSGLSSGHSAPGVASPPFGKALLRSVVLGRPLNSSDAILSWLTELKSVHHLAIATRSLDELDGWVVEEDQIRHREGRYFRVIGVDVEATGREVKAWTQPMLDHPGMGLNGLVTQRIRGVPHFLMRACLYPGNRDTFDLGSTVSRSSYESQFDRADAPPFLSLFRDPPPEQVLFDSVQSEEGGRFYHYQNRYMILELPGDEPTEVPPEFMWMTLPQVQRLTRHGYVNIEGRNLLACVRLAVDEA